MSSKVPTVGHKLPPLHQWWDFLMSWHSPARKKITYNCSRHRFFARQAQQSKGYDLFTHPTIYPSSSNCINFPKAMSTLHVRFGILLMAEWIQFFMDILLGEESIVVAFDIRGEIWQCRNCRRQCKIFASGVNFSRNNAIYNINESTKYILPWFHL